MTIHRQRKNYSGGSNSNSRRNHHHQSHQDQEVVWHAQERKLTRWNADRRPSSTTGNNFRRADASADASCEENLDGNHMNMNHAAGNMSTSTRANDKGSCAIVAIPEISGFVDLVLVDSPSIGQHAVSTSSRTRTTPQTSDVKLKLQPKFDYEANKEQGKENAATGAGAALDADDPQRGGATRATVTPWGNTYNAAEVDSRDAMVQSVKATMIVHGGVPVVTTTSSCTSISGDSTRHSSSADTTNDSDEKEMNHHTPAAPGPLPDMPFNISTLTHLVQCLEQVVQEDVDGQVHDNGSKIQQALDALQLVYETYRLEEFYLDKAKESVLSTSSPHASLSALTLLPQQQQQHKNADANTNYYENHNGTVTDNALSGLDLDFATMRNIGQVAQGLMEVTKSSKNNKEVKVGKAFVAMEARLDDHEQNWKFNVVKSQSPPMPNITFPSANSYSEDETRDDDDSAMHNKAAVGMDYQDGEDDDQSRDSASQITPSSPPLVSTSTAMSIMDLNLLGLSQDLNIAAAELDGILAKNNSE
jgi:hypothetical protein